MTLTLVHSDTFEILDTRQTWPAEPPELVSFVDLRAEYPELSPHRQGESSQACAARNVRNALARAFPGVKFSVTSASASQTSSVSVRWIDGPTEAEVEPFVDRHQYCDFDGSDDSSNYRRDGREFRELFGSCRFAKVNREFSDAAIEYAISRVCERLCDGWTVPTVAQYRHGDAWRMSPTSHRNWYQETRDVLELRGNYAPKETAA